MPLLLGTVVTFIVCLIGVSCLRIIDGA